MFNPVAPYRYRLSTMYLSFVSFGTSSVLSPVLFNIDTNDQPVHKNTHSFIYAADLYIATQYASFEKTQSTFRDALENGGKHYA